SKGGGSRRLLVGEVTQLVRVGRKVVELGLWSQDVLPRSPSEDAQIAPPEMQQWHERLGILRTVARWPAPERTREVVARRLKPARQLDAKQTDRRRKNVDEPHVGLELQAADDAGTAHDEWHPERRLVDEETVQCLFMVPKSLAVIRCHDQQRS